MEVKEKAKELVDKYFSEMQFSEFVDDLDASKQCALIAVDELINATQYKCHIEYAHNECETVEYWLEVKTEIEKL